MGGVHSAPPARPRNTHGPAGPGAERDGCVLPSCNVVLRQSLLIRKGGNEVSPWDGRPLEQFRDAEKMNNSLALSCVPTSLLVGDTQVAA